MSIQSFACESLKPVDNPCTAVAPLGALSGSPRTLRCCTEVAHRPAHVTPKTFACESLKSARHLCSWLPDGPVPNVGRLTLAPWGAISAKTEDVDLTVDARIAILVGIAPGVPR